MDTHGFQVTSYIGHMSAKRSSATSFIQTVNLMKKFIRFPLRLQKAFDNIDSMSLIFCNHDAEQEFSEFIRAGVGLWRVMKLLSIMKLLRKPALNLISSGLIFPKHKCWIYRPFRLWLMYQNEASPARIIPQNAKVSPAKIIPQNAKVSPARIIPQNAKVSPTSIISQNAEVSPTKIIPWKWLAVVTHAKTPDSKKNLRLLVYG